jgi:hypothetical protein
MLGLPFRMEVLWARQIELKPNDSGGCSQHLTALDGPGKGRKVDLAHGEQSDPKGLPVSPPLGRDSDPSLPAEELFSVPTQSTAGTTLVAVPVDPYVVHCQWNIESADIERAKRELGVREGEYWPALRFFEVSDAPHHDQARSPAFSAEVQLEAGNWFVRSCSPERVYRADLVLKTEDGSFRVVATSNPVETPPSVPSHHSDAGWQPIRLHPRLPQSAALLRDSSDPATQSSSDTPGEFAGRLPIDMRAEVRAKLTALYGGPNREALEPPAPSGSADDRSGERETVKPACPSPSPLPIDMRQEVRRLLTQLYQGREQDSAATADEAGFLAEVCVIEPGRPMARIKEAANHIADLTDLNEQSFALGISSRMK